MVGNAAQAGRGVGNTGYWHKQGRPCRMGGVRRRVLDFSRALMIIIGYKI